MNEIKRELFEPFIKKLLEANKTINLISRATNPDEIFSKHIYDSLKIADFLDFSKIKNILDIGSGGGIPGIPLAIAFPEIKVTLLDSTGKKMRAAKQIATDLNLKNVTTITGRAEEKAFDPNLREKFDVVTARAVAKLPELLKYAMPFVKIGGFFVAYKGRNYEEELSQSKNAIRIFGAKLSKIHKYTLLDNLGERVYIIFENTHGAMQGAKLALHNKEA